MNSIKAYTNLFLSVLSEIYIIGALLGVVAIGIDSTEMFLGYFVSIFWYVFVLHFFLSRHDSSRFSVKDSLGLILVVSLWFAFIFYIYGDSFVSYLKTFSVEVWYMIGFFSLISLLRLIFESFKIRQLNLQETKYQQRKNFHDGLMKLVFGFLGVFLVVSLPQLDSDTFGFITPTLQTLFFTGTFLLFAVQDFWFWQIERKSYSHEDKMKKVQLFSLFFVLACLSMVVVGVLHDGLVSLASYF